MDGEMEEKEEKFPLCESIGHRPLQGRCPKRSFERNERCQKVKDAFSENQNWLKIASPLTITFPTPGRKGRILNSVRRRKGGGGGGDE